MTIEERTEWWSNNRHIWGKDFPGRRAARTKAWDGNNLACLKYSQETGEAKRLSPAQSEGQEEQRGWRGQEVGGNVYYSQYNRHPLPSTFTSNCGFLTRKCHNLKHRMITLVISGAQRAGGAPVGVANMSRPEAMRVARRDGGRCLCKRCMEGICLIRREVTPWRLSSHGAWYWGD